MKKLLFIPLLACAGCFQVLRFTDGGAYYSYPRSKYRATHPYRATKEVAKEWVMAPARVYGWWGMSTDDPIGAAWMTLLWPVGVVDCVCETACDTVMCVPDWILADPAPAKMNKEDENDEE